MNTTVTTVRKTWWKSAWAISLLILAIAVAAWAWWAKPAFLFGAKNSANADGSYGPGGAGAGAGAGKPPGGGGFGAGGGGFGPGGPGGPGGRRGGMAPVGAAKAHVGDVNIYLPALGTVQAANTATVRARIDGLVLVKLNFKEGQTVKQGDVLAELDARAAQVQLAMAQAQLARDAAQLQNAKVDQERYRNLLAQDSIAKQQLDTQEALVRQYEATLKIDQANVDSAKLQLSYTRIVVPATGRIGLRQVDLGNVVRASDTNGIAVITQLQPVNVVFTVPELNITRVLRQLQDGTPMPVEAWNREMTAKIATGSLLTTDNQIDTSTGTIKLKSVFANDDLALFPNQFVNVRLLMDVRHNATLVPTAAIQRGTDSSFVYVVNADKSIALRNVRIGTVQGDDTMVIEGIAPGEVVVIDGTDRLREGMKVEAIVRADQPVAPAGQGQHRRGQGGHNGQGLGGNRPAWMTGNGPPGGSGAGSPPDAVNGAGSAAPNAASATPGAAPNGAPAASFNGTPPGFAGGRPMNPDGTPRQWPGNGGRPPAVP